MSSVTCQVCNRVFSSRSAKSTHLRKHCRGGVDVHMSKLEYQLFKPSSAGNNFVHCVECGENSGCGDVYKRQILRHCQKKHCDIDPEVLKSFVVYKEMCTLQAGRNLPEWTDFDKTWEVQHNIALGDQAGLIFEGCGEIAASSGDCSATDVVSEHNVVSEPNVIREPNIEILDCTDTEVVPEPNIEIISKRPKRYNTFLPGISCDDEEMQVAELQTIRDMLIRQQEQIQLLNSTIPEHFDLTIQPIIISFNRTIESFKENLGDIKSKYDVSIKKWLVDWDCSVHGHNFPNDKLATNFDLGAFPTHLFTMRGLDETTCRNHIRYITQFLGGFDFEDAAGKDLPNLLFVIYRNDFIEKVWSMPLWQTKPSRAWGLKTALSYLALYLHRMQETVRPFGGLTTVLSNISVRINLDLANAIKKQKGVRRCARAIADGVNLENWVGPKKWGFMVELAMEGLQFIYNNKATPGFWDEHIHRLANEFMIVILFLNSYPGRAGGWELLEQEEMRTQRKMNQPVYKFVRHKTAETYGPQLKWVPAAVAEAIWLYQQLPIRKNKYWLVPHSKAMMVCVASLLQDASATLGYPGAVPNSNFIRKLFHTKVAEGDVVAEQTWLSLMKDLAAIDCHSIAIANSEHYDLSERTQGGIVKKSHRAYVSIMGRNPRRFAADYTMTMDEFVEMYPKNRPHGKPTKTEILADYDHDVQAQMQKKRTAEGLEKQVQKAARVTATKLRNKKILECYAEIKSRGGIQKAFYNEIVDKVVAAGFECTYLQARYVCVGH